MFWNVSLVSETFSPKLRERLLRDDVINDFIRPGSTIRKDHIDMPCRGTLCWNFVQFRQELPEKMYFKGTWINSFRYQTYQVAAACGRRLYTSAARSAIPSDNHRPSFVSCCSIHRLELIACSPPVFTISLDVSTTAKDIPLSTIIPDIVIWHRCTALLWTSQWLYVILATLKTLIDWLIERKSRRRHYDVIESRDVTESPIAPLHCHVDSTYHVSWISADRKRRTSCGPTE